MPKRTQPGSSTLRTPIRSISRPMIGTRMATIHVAAASAVPSCVRLMWSTSGNTALKLALVDAIITFGPTRKPIQAPKAASTDGRVNSRLLAVAPMTAISAPLILFMAPS